MPGREYLVQGMDNLMVQAYLNYATEIAKLLGAKESTAAKDMTAMVEFEIQLANVSNQQISPYNLKLNQL